MGLAECIASASTGIGILIHARTEPFTSMEFVTGMESQTDKKNLLDIFRYVVESSKQHFNPSYRLQGLYLVYLDYVIFNIHFDNVRSHRVILHLDYVYSLRQDS